MCEMICNGHIIEKRIARIMVCVFLYLHMRPAHEARLVLLCEEQVREKTFGNRTLRGNQRMRMFFVRHSAAMTLRPQSRASWPLKDSAISAKHYRMARGRRGRAVS